MKRCIWIISLWLALGVVGWAQDATPAPSNIPGAGNPPAEKQENAASATQDNSGTTGDQITKPAGAKGSVLIGCLEGPDKDGKFMVRNMNYRTGVQVLGSDDLKNDAGSKVKLTGQWQPGAASPGQITGAAEPKKFQVTEVEVTAQKCSVPSETTPVSKNKKQKPTTYDAPSAESAK